MNPNKFAFSSYAQEGEDMILYRIFGEKRDGFFIDIGAYHPFKYSNTYFYYKRGWRGINIDAMPGSMQLFEEYRPEDINIEAIISDRAESLEYFIFNEPALNSCNATLSKKRDIAKTQFKLEKSVMLESSRLDTLLNKYVPDSKEIDFMSIDVESHELEVLLSNNWDKYLPKVILVEFLKSTVESIIDEEISHFLQKKDYTIFAKSFNTVFYIQKDFFLIRMGLK